MVPATGVSVTDVDATDVDVPASDLDVFAGEVEVEPSTGSHPRLPVVLAALVGAGVLAAGVVVFGVVTAVSVSETISAGSGCTAAEPCTGYDLADVAERTGLVIPGAEVVDSSYVSESGETAFRAELELPAGASPDFAAANFGVVPEPGTDWSDELAGRESEPIGYYAASGNGGLTVGNALHTLLPDGTEVVLVEVLTR